MNNEHEIWWQSWHQSNMASILVRTSRISRDISLNIFWCWFILYGYFNWNSWDRSPGWPLSQLTAVLNQYEPTDFFRLLGKKMGVDLVLWHNDLIINHIKSTFERTHVLEMADLPALFLLLHFLCFFLAAACLQSCSVLTCLITKW